MTSWQEHELSFWRTWLPANKPTYGLVFQRYAPLATYAHSVEGKQGAALDIGCGPFPYSKAFDFKEYVLVDPLIDEYARIEGSSITDKDSRFTHVRAVPKQAYSVVFILNCLDHMPPEERVEICTAVQQLRPQYVLVHVNLRTHEQVEPVHPFPFSVHTLDELTMGWGTPVYDGIGRSDDTHNGQELPALQRVYYHP